MWLHGVIRKWNERDSALFNRLAPVLKTIFHQCVIPYTCSQSNSDGSVLSGKPYTCSQSNSDGSVFKTEPSELD